MHPLGALLVVLVGVVPRIRNIKPDFFRHEELQSLGPTTMLVFIGLWTQADKAGNFQWKLSQIRLDILPFVEYDLKTSLEQLVKSGFIAPYVGDDGKPYGHIFNFTSHQRFSGSEAKAPPKNPPFLGDVRLNGEKGSSSEVPRMFLGSV